MPDDLDDLDAALRRTMASLDGQTPAGYFDALPARTLARLDDAAPGEPREELDDIRDLASETRARLSAQRAAQGAPGSPRADLDHDVAASSSVWKAIALPEHPQPATSQPALTSQPPAVPQSPGEAVSPSAPPASTALASAQRSGSRGGRRTAWVAIAGGLAAASAVGYLAVARRGAGDAELVAARESRVAAVPSEAAQKPSAAPTDVASARSVPGDAGIPEPSRAGAGTAASGTGRSAGIADGRAIELPRPGDTRDASLRPTPRAGESAGKSPDAPRIATIDRPAKKESRPIAKRADAGKAPAKGDELGGPSAKGALAGSEALGKFNHFKPIDNLKPGDDPKPGSAKPSDNARPGAEPAAGAAAGSGSGQVPLAQLIGESGAAKPAPVKAKLERTSLSSDDIKRGMFAVARKAQACFAGTQGLASLRLTVAPSGRVVKVTVSGMFAGSPTGACVERAVKAARFPPWEGGPQSFNYNYLLSD